MYKTNIEKSENKLLVDIAGLQSMLSIGKNTAAKIGIEAGAVIKIGRRTLYNTRKIQEFIEANNNISLNEV